MKHLPLIVAVFLAVLLGSLGAKYLHTLWILDQAGHAVELLNADANRAADRLRAQTARTVATQRQRRADSARGKDLLRRCEEFSNAYADNGGAYAREQREKACERYRTFVKTGR